MKKSPRILWIAGWYPSEANQFSGDFVQRHALSTSQYSPLHVIHLAIVFNQHFKDSISKPTVNLTEEIHYVQFIRLGLLGKIWNNIKFFMVLKNAVNQYVKQNGNPHIVHFHAPDKTAGIAKWIKKTGAFILLTEHWAIYNKVVKDNYYVRSNRFKNRIKQLCKVADLGIQTGRSIHDDMQTATGVEFPFENIPNAVDIRHFYFEKDKPEEPFIFVHASVLDSRKNVMGMLRSFLKLSEKYQSIQLKLIGPVNPEIKIFIKTNHLEDRVILTGELHYTQVAEHMRNSHVFVLFSWMENAPCVIFEALCCGLPVVSSSIASVPENIVDGRNGYLCTAGNESELTYAMEKSFLNYSQFKPFDISMTSSARFSFETVGKRIYDLYIKILN